MRNVFDVDSPRGDVGCDEDAESARFEPGQRLRALRLRPVAVDPLRGDPIAGERIGETVRAVFRAGEGEDRLQVAAAQQLEEERRLELLGDRIDGLRDAGRGRRFALEVDE